MIKEKSSYPDFAEHAASLERVGYLKDAAFAWQVAASYAVKPENRHWAESRSQFCEKWAWRYEKEAA
ncbi:TPA: ANR family transcriptional regulator [Vibrio parahaemolyticus]|uniref:ANR family transcriptional regulator n=1 Tax=Vibrio TaxID=662 RepID=UPI000DFC57F7|nr:MULTISPECIES: ANR family transcriptional regulator [Vibrio]EGR1143189.1 ANR family transcriptional regulator [Vibrio parahaemolyticus]EJG1710650.1 ANR family transcriptional regulator [Vibrio parahaemolyticus]EJG1744027.1 ANR family transcriptional regulator [Vibrio parahaemolyticus]EJG1781741.1 ANR family transcriptional regulator [Vibrio parahaemolyticus]ELB1648128.1 ANR family transcriptional regulator [Vibrio parahaemolyticus]